MYPVERLDQATEEEAFECARRFLSYLPPSVYELPPRGPQTDDPERQVDWLLDAIPRDIRKVYKMRKIIEAVFDTGSFFEMSPLYGRSQIVGLARLGGTPVGVFANDPMFYAGSMGAEGAQKVARFQDQMAASDDYNYNGATEWPGLIRMLDKRDPDYAT